MEDDLEEGLNHFEGSSPENLFFALLPMDQTGKLPRTGDALGDQLFGDFQGIDSVVLRVKKGSQRNGNDFFHLPTEFRLPRAFHSSYQRKDDPSPA
jgi:hypothetical protein